MKEVSIIGIDLSKSSYQFHGAHADGSVAFRRKQSRGRVLPFLSSHAACTVAMEACGGAHYWGREIGKLGHEVRLIPPIYVKPYVKRQKNDAADAEAICEAAQRPTMRFVAVKSEEQQARAMQLGVRMLLVRQRTQTINALRGHLAEFGLVAPRGPAHVARLAWALENGEGVSLPALTREMGALLLEQIAELDGKVAALDRTLRAAAREDEEAARAMTVPGGGADHRAGAPGPGPAARNLPQGTRLLCLARSHAPPAHNRRQAAARQNIEKGPEGPASPAGGRSSVIQNATRRGQCDDPWLARLLVSKPRKRKLVAVALANRMARILWALAVKKETYRAPAAA